MKIVYKFLEYVKLLGKVFNLLWKSSWRMTILIIIINMINGIIAPISTITWKNFIDESLLSLESNNVQRPILFIILFFLLIMVSRTIIYVNEYLQNMLCSKINQYTSKIVLEKIDKLEMSSFDNSELYDQIQKINSESTTRSLNILVNITNFVKSISTIFGTLIVLLKFSFILIFVCIITCIPTLVISMKMATEQYEIYNKRFEKNRFISTLKSLVIDYENIKEIKVNCLVKYFDNYIQDQYDQFIKKDKNVQGKYCLKKSLSNFFEEIITLFLRIAILFRVVVKKRTIGELSLYITSVDNFRNAISVVTGTIVSTFEDALYIESLFTFLDNVNLESRDGSKKFCKKFKNIEFVDVWFKYPNDNKYVLRGINFTLESNKSYSFVGLNGSGKTTLIKLLLKLYKPSKGRILIDGEDLQNIETKSYYESIGVVFQDFIKYPLDVKNNIGCGCINKMNDENMIHLAAKKSGADRFIEKLPQKYNTKLNKEWSEAIQLSLGQWQKIAISRAFMDNFSIVVLDEPTASLDPEAEYELYSKFKEMIDGRLSILVAHRFSTVKLVHKIFVIKDGKILEEGTHNELIKKNAIYAKLFNLQADTYKNEEKGN